MCLTMGTKAVYPPGMPAEPWRSLEMQSDDKWRHYHPSSRIPHR